jgi:leucyl aminopeptidase
MVDLATLTGAILVALGNEHAGLFSNDDTLSERLHAVGQVTGERVWRMPLDKNYDKMIDSKFADMKNAGARNAGSITAAHFIKRFVGTAMSSPETDINKSWASGWGVRLLDRLVADYYEI